MTCFNVTGLESSLAVRLGVPIYCCAQTFFCSA